MPYIDPAGERRFELVQHIELPENPGELSYLITMLLLDYLEENGIRYQTINDILGALEGAKLEFYRRVAVPYEDQKILENGDVYGE